MLRSRSVYYAISRLKHGKTHWSMLENKQLPVHRALDNFDDFYGSVFGNRWKSIRIALLTQHKYIALVNNFGDTEETIKALEADGAINVHALYNAGKNLLSESINSNQEKHNIIDKKIDTFLNKQEQDEVNSIYGQTSADYIPEKLNQSIETTQENNLSSVDYKKSLNRVLSEDSEIDVTRLVDPSIASVGLQEFIPATKIKGMEDFVFESDHYKYYSNTTDFPIKMEMQKEFTIPENLHLYSYEKGNVSEFIKPRRSKLTDVYSHFLMDGASILPPLALNILPGDRVLDACAAPGGKSLLMLQSLNPSIVVCNDVQESRVNRIKSIMKQYFYDFDTKWNKKRCLITRQDAKTMDEYGEYDKILVDVPCTTDRHSLVENDNNIFKPTRSKERLRLPENQASILSNCIRLLKPGGSLVYSTCSLSPVQNDGVVHMALSRVFTEHNITLTINDLSVVMRPFETIFKFENSNGLKYGQMVLPYLPANFGPMYFCKLTRN